MVFYQNSLQRQQILYCTYIIREMLQADDLPVFWLVMMTNSTSSPGLSMVPSFTSDWWKNSFFPSSVSWFRKPYCPAKYKVQEYINIAYPTTFKQDIAKKPSFCL